MKKFIKVIGVTSLLTLALALASCGTESTENASNNAESENVESTPIQAEQTNTEDNISDEPETILYENTDFGFSMQIPLSWEGKYSTENVENTFDDGVVVQAVMFKHNATMDELGSEAGWMFSFGKITGEQFTPEEPPVMQGECRIIEQTGGYTYFVSFPSGVEYNEEAGSESAIEYKEMQSEVDFLIDSFELLEK